MTKLTLSMDQEVVATAKRIARRHRQSVSAMLSNMVRAMAAREDLHDGDIPKDSLAARALGLVKLPHGKTVDEVLYEALCEKYELEPK